MRFGGITPSIDVVLDRAGPDLRADRSKRRWQDDVVQRHQPDLRPHQGTITFDGLDLLGSTSPDLHLGIFRTFQNLALWPGLTVFENVMVGVALQAKANFVTRRCGSGPGEEQSHGGGRSSVARFGLGEVAFQPAAGLPFGTLKRVEIARRWPRGPSC